MDGRRQVTKEEQDKAANHNSDVHEDHYVLPTIGAATLAVRGGWLMQDGALPFCSMRRPLPAPTLQLWTTAPVLSIK